MKNSSPTADVFCGLVSRLADPTAQKWFNDAIDFANDGFDQNAFLTAFAVAARKLGYAPVRLVEKEEQAFKEAGALFAPQGWPLDEIGRTALLLAACEAIEQPAAVKLVLELYYRGDNREKEIVLRALSFLPDSGRFAQVAVEACRAHVQTVFEAITCDNPYPAVHFSDDQFNQMVLKALFTGAKLERIVGWQQRNNPELVRMAADYASERRAAKRSVPKGIQMIIDDAKE